MKKNEVKKFNLSGSLFHVKTNVKGLITKSFNFNMIELLIAFGAGLISFLSPCVLPLIPGYISFISGASLNELLAKKKIDLLPLILFSLGFSFVFIIFGAAASYLGQVLLQNSQTLRIVAGLIIIIFSLTITWNFKY